MVFRNQCIAETVNRFPIDLYHINDYHGACAPLYLLPRTIPAALSLHNAEFQGMWPMRTPEESKEVCEVFNLSEDVVKEYVQFGSGKNSLLAAMIVNMANLLKQSSTCCTPAQAISAFINRVLERSVSRRNTVIDRLHGIRFSGVCPRSDSCQTQIRRCVAFVYDVNMMMLLIWTLVRTRPTGTRMRCSPRHPRSTKISKPQEVSSDARHRNGLVLSRTPMPSCLCLSADGVCKRVWT